jgi:hypothetical protein
MNAIRPTLALLQIIPAGGAHTLPIHEATLTGRSRAVACPVCVPYERGPVLHGVTGRGEGLPRRKARPRTPPSHPLLHRGGSPLRRCTAREEPDSQHLHTARQARSLHIGWDPPSPPGAGAAEKWRGASGKNRRLLLHELSEFLIDWKSLLRSAITVLFNGQLFVFSHWCSTCLSSFQFFTV